MSLELLSNLKEEISDQIVVEIINDISELNYQTVFNSHKDRRYGFVRKGASYSENIPPLFELSIINLALSLSVYGDLNDLEEARKIVTNSFRKNRIFIHLKEDGEPESDEKHLEILEAIHLLDVEEEFSELENNQLLEKIKHTFVHNDPRVWWLSLKYIPSKLIVQNEFEYRAISEHLDPESTCYFIAELDETHLFKSKVKNIQSVIGECSFFEYYVINEKLEKFICETDHGDLLYIDIKSNKAS